MKMIRRRALFVAGVAFAALLAGGPSLQAITMYDEVGEDGLTYHSLVGSGVVGDGIDDCVSWDFDFSGDPSYASFMASDVLSSANLWLDLKPMHALHTTDAVRVVGLAWVLPAAIHSVPVGVLSRVNLNLLDFYTADQLLGVLTSSGGVLSMGYCDDSLVLGAGLSLGGGSQAPSGMNSNVSVPDTSATLPMLMMAVGAVFGLRRLSIKGA